MQDVVSLYQETLAKRGFATDSSQWRAVERLQQLYEEWTAYKAKRSSALKRLLPGRPFPGRLPVGAGWGAARAF